MNHVSGAGHALQCALRDVLMKVNRLLRFNQSILCPSKDGDGHLQIGVRPLEFMDARDHESRLSRSSPNLRWAYRHFLRETFKLWGHQVWTEKLS